MSCKGVGVSDVADGGVGALRAVVGVRRGERRRLTARGARAREDEERLGDELCEGSEIPGVSVTVDRQSLEARGFDPAVAAVVAGRRSTTLTAPYALSRRQTLIAFSSDIFYLAPTP